MARRVGFIRWLGRNECWRLHPNTQDVDCRGVLLNGADAYDITSATAVSETAVEEDCHLVSKRVPFGAKTTRQIRYQIDDPFYRFWFRFIFKYDHMVRIA